MYFFVPSVFNAINYLVWNLKENCIFRPAASRYIDRLGKTNPFIECFCCYNERERRNVSQKDIFRLYLLSCYLLFFIWCKGVIKYMRCPKSQRDISKRLIKGHNSKNNQNFQKVKKNVFRTSLSERFCQLSARNLNYCRG